MATPAAIRMAAAPTAMPPMAPPDMPPPDDAAALAVDAADVAAVGYAVADEELLEVVGDPSLGQFSPGNNMKVLSWASCFCRARLVFALGLMTPTMPQPIQLPGAPQ